MTVRGMLYRQDNYAVCNELYTGYMMWSNDLQRVQTINKIPYPIFLYLFPILKIPIPKKIPLPPKDFVFFVPNP